MKELFLSECRRFRTLSLVAAAVLLVLLQLAIRMADPLQQRWQVQMIMFLAIAAMGLAFAVVQFNGYRQPSRWLWLMHRPLARGRIFGALALASLVLLGVAVGLPALLAVAGTDYFTGDTIDTRHYLIPLHLLLASYTAWLAGCYLVLCGRRSAFVVLFVPSVLVLHLASGAALLAPAAIGLALMAALAYTAFRPNRTGPPAGPGAHLASAIPLVLGFYLLMLWGGSTVFQVGQMLLGVNPLNSKVAPAGGYRELVRSPGGDNLQRALALSSDPRAAHWRRQLALLEVGKIEPQGREHPVRGAIANLDATQWRDGKRNIAWTFNHDRMLYEGRDMHTDAPRGWFGMGGMGDLRPFDSPPLIVMKSFMTQQRLFGIDSESGRAPTLLTVSGAEKMTGGVQEVGRQPFVLTNQRLIAFRRQASAQAPLEEAYSVPLPGPFGDLNRIDVARLLDGTLLSFNFGRRMVNGETGSRQQVLFVDAAGHATPVASRLVGHDFPLLFEHKDWWLSPVANAVMTLPERLLDRGLIEDAPGTPVGARPPAVVAAALVAALLSAVLAAWRLQGQPMRYRLAWTVAALVLGPPCAAALWVLAPRAIPASTAAVETQGAPIPAA
ncbi:hypothetical protein [Massilia varians]|uniref:hypothetical protein n=1 Tax=Massilia varians TaxID=457921 RepID=UPI0025555376|nr:hypothetical protein [Massilia varians]MDK6077242.1 hypothetical protein [Massilia varians]